MKKEESGFPVHNALPPYLQDRINTTQPKHRDNRRAFFNDYCSQGYYLITATTNAGALPLSIIPNLPLDSLRKGEMIIPTHTPLGEAIRKEINDIPIHHPEIRILRFIIMPDHIHIVLHVKTRLKRKLGRELAGFFGACSKHFSRLSGSEELRTLFMPFHDRIIFNYEQLDRAIKYVEDNPRRLIIKRYYPDLFKRYLHLEIDGHEYAAYGNIFLLKEIYLLPVRIHRRWSEKEFEEYKESCIAEIEKGAIPISPAIHKAEKEILNQAIKLGGRVIKLTDYGYEKRFKPQGVKFELCAEGRLLLLAPWPENTGRKSTSGYTEFHKMNDFAKTIASLSPSTRLSIKNS